MTTTETDNEPYVAFLAIEQLAPAPDNLRRKVDDGPAFKELLASVKANGILVPLTVTPNGGPNSFMIVAGHRRYEAARQAKIVDVPCLVQVMTDEQRMVAMLVENLARVDIDPVEEAAGYFRACELGLTQKELAKRVGRPAAHIGRRLALLNLPAKVLALLKLGKITVEEALALIPLVEAGADEKVIMECATNRDVEWAAKRVLSELAFTRVADAVIADLAKAGTKATTDSPYSLGTKADRLDSLTAIRGDVVARHRKEPCAMVCVIRAPSYVKDRVVDEIDLCMDRKRHGPKGESSMKFKKAGQAPDPRADAAKAEAKATRDIAKARTEAIAVALERKIPKARIIDSVVADQVPRLVTWDMAPKIGLVLGVAPDEHSTPPVNQGGKPRVTKEWIGPILRWWGHDTDRGLRILLAHSMLAERNSENARTVATLMEYGGYAPSEAQIERWQRDAIYEDERRTRDAERERADAEREAANTAVRSERFDTLQSTFVPWADEHLTGMASEIVEWATQAWLGGADFEAILDEIAAAGADDDGEDPEGTEQEAYDELDSDDNEMVEGLDE